MLYSYLNNDKLIKKVSDLCLIRSIRNLTNTESELFISLFIELKRRKLTFKLNNNPKI
jgi:hypothetical protein